MMQIFTLTIAIALACAARAAGAGGCRFLLASEPPPAEQAKMMVNLAATEKSLKAEYATKAFNVLASATPDWRSHILARMKNLTPAMYLTEGRISSTGWFWAAQALERLYDFLADHPNDAKRGVANFVENRQDLNFVEARPYVSAANRQRLQLGSNPAGEESLTLRLSYFPTDPEFARQMYQCALSLAEAFRQVLAGNLAKPELSEVLQTIGDNRRNVAMALGARDMASFGRFRDDTRLVTPMRPWGKYHDYADRYQDFMKSRGAAFRRTIRLAGTQRVVRLTSIVVRRGFSAESQPETILETNTRGEADRIVSYVNHVLFPSLLQVRQLSPGEIIDRVAELHWWLSHASIFQRGSAAATDTLTKALLLARGIPFGRWKAHIAPDLEAPFYTREEFIERYASFME